MAVDWGTTLYRTIMGGIEGYGMGQQWNAQDERLKLAKTEEERRKLMDTLTLAGRGVYQGEAPDESIDVPFVAPGMPAPPSVKVTPDRYRPIGDTGFYQDYTMTPAGIAGANRTMRQGIANQIGFDRDWKAGTEAITEQNEVSAEQEQQSRVLEALKASGLFTPGEMAMAAASPGSADSFVRTGLQRGTQGRRGGGASGPSGRTGGDPDARAITREDSRRRAIVSGDESQMRRAPRDSYSRELIDPAKQDSLQAHADSVRGRIGSMPDSGVGMHQMTRSERSTADDVSPTADLEVEATEEAKRAIAAGADPELVNKRLIQYLQQIRAGQYE